MTGKTDNMALWNAVCKTDPDVTKEVNQRGGFTAISAYSQIKTATEYWGPFGKAWGLKECVYDYVRDAKGDPVEITIEAVFFSPVGSFEVSTDKAFRVGDDNRKKIRTDAITKALSYLGFNADVFMGLFDDNKYVADLRKEKAEAGKKFTRKDSGGQAALDAGDNGSSAVNTISLKYPDGETVEFKDGKQFFISLEAAIPKTPQIVFIAENAKTLDGISAKSEKGAAKVKEMRDMSSAAA